MTKRIVLVLLVLTALAVPAIALGDDNGPTGTTPAAAGAGRLTARIERLTHRVDARFATFSKHCLVQNAPARCARVAHRLVVRWTALGNRAKRIEGRIDRRCGATSPPAGCAGKSEILQKLDDLTGSLTSDIGKVQGAFPAA